MLNVMNISSSVIAAISFADSFAIQRASAGSPVATGTFSLDIESHPHSQDGDARTFRIRYRGTDHHRISVLSFVLMHNGANWFSASGKYKDGTTHLEEAASLKVQGGRYNGNPEWDINWFE